MRMASFKVVDVDDPQGIKTEIEANTAQGAANKWRRISPQSSLRENPIVLVYDAVTGEELGTFTAYLKPEGEDGED